MSHAHAACDASHSARVQFSSHAGRKIADVPRAFIFRSASVTYKYRSGALNPLKAALKRTPSMCSCSDSFLIPRLDQMFLIANHVILTVFLHLTFTRVLTVLLLFLYLYPHRRVFTCLQPSRR